NERGVRATEGVRARRAQRAHHALIEGILHPLLFLWVLLYCGCMLAAAAESRRSSQWEGGGVALIGDVFEETFPGLDLAVARAARAAGRMSGCGPVVLVELAIAIEPDDGVGVLGRPAACDI
ncbi:hypothetical protein EVJ58_g3031, partial [Rhodofomes roseus]